MATKLFKFCWFSDCVRWGGVILSCLFFLQLSFGSEGGFVLTNARLGVEEVSSGQGEGEEVLREEHGFYQPLPRDLKPSTAEVVHASGGLVLIERESPVIMETGKEKPASEGGILVFSEERVAPEGLVSPLLEAFPEWSLGSKPRFLRFGEVW